MIRDIKDRIILFRRDLLSLNRIICRVLKIFTMKVAVYKKDCSSKRIHSGSIVDVDLLKARATLHPAPKDLHFHSLQPDVLRNVFRNYYLMEVTPKKNSVVLICRKNQVVTNFRKA
jgi:hypothetical protein